ncbi:MAG: TolC family protein [Parachlamydiaceae bacterium]
MIRTKHVLILFFYLIYFTDGWGEDPFILSLRQAENIAIKNNYQINASLHRLEQGYYGYKASQAYFKPQVSFASQIDLTKDENSLDAVLKMTQPLYDKVARYQLKEAEIQWEMAKLELQQKICDILFEVRKAYFTILLNQAHVNVDKVIIELWEEELKRQERLLELGGAIPFDLNQIRLHLKSARSDYYDSEGEVKTSEIKLLTILGLAPNTRFKLDENDIPLPPSDWQYGGVERWKQLALEYRPQLRQQQFSYLLSKAKVKQVKSERLPTVSFYANAGNRYVNNGFIAQPYVGAGVNVDWSLYDPTNHYRVKQAKEGLHEAASDYFQADLEIDAIIYALLNQLNQSYLAYQNAKEGASLAQEGMEMAVRKHQIGMMSSFEYRDTIKTLHEAEQQVNQAKFDLHNVYDRLIQHVGLDLKKDPLCISGS